ncbi:uncharacterized protein LOC108683446 [Hyalella azteca]|uniref:Uncharacterized protein LOC108683446 n=1 Tax=Hyalella azteca TaxID=294128 RepID=A0A8B7PRW9_HYAAZ|nr:uncharacterized protein LOC108683446 [Hyalella azteca]
MYTKKKFLDVPECLLLELENLKSEVQVLRCTVDSKSRAVVILRKQLAAVKEHAGILDTRHQGTQTDSKPTLHESGSGSPERESPHSSSNVLAELLSSCKRENKALRQDILNLKCKLHDAQTDLKAVRQEIPMLVAGSGSGLAAPGPLQQQWQRQERLHLIAQLETLTDKE